MRSRAPSGSDPPTHRPSAYPLQVRQQAGLEPECCASRDPLGAGLAPSHRVHERATTSHGTVSADRLDYRQFANFPISFDFLIHRVFNFRMTIEPEAIVFLLMILAGTAFFLVLSFRPIL